MNTTRTARSAAAFALSAAVTLAMLASVGALFGSDAQGPSAELARAADRTPAQVVVIEGKRIPPTQVVVIEGKRNARS